MIDLSQLGARIQPQLYADMQGVAEAAVAHILSASIEAFAERGAFHIVLAGGTTPGLVYRLLVDADTDWRCWHIYFGDERCLPRDDPARNSVMAQRAWLDHVAIPPCQIHPIAAELGADEGAKAYSLVVEKAQPFDLVLLGMGEDGHTASLFPGQQHVANEWVHAVHHAPKPPSDRVSLSFDSLSRCKQLILLVTGTSKYEALARWASGEGLPVSALKSSGEILLLVDRSAVER
jgi:6-phosphogluconolactonase